MENTQTVQQTQNRKVVAIIYVLIVLNLLIAVSWYFMLLQLDLNNLMKVSGCFHLLAVAFMSFYNGPDFLPYRTKVLTPAMEEEKLKALDKLAWTLGFFLLGSMVIGSSALGAIYTF